MSYAVISVAGNKKFESEPPPPPPDNGAADLVAAGWNRAQDFATDAYDKATTFLDSLQTIATNAASVPYVSGELDAIVSELVPYTAPPVPNEPQNLGMVLPVAPVIPDLDSTLDALRTKLAEWVAGESTGLEPAVEQQIWDRARAREHALTQRKVLEVTRGFAARGFAKPPGAMAVEIQEALQDQQDKESTLSRDIAIKQADLEQANRKFAMEQTLELAKTLLAAGEMQVRMFVGLVTAEAQRVTSEAQVYEARSRAYAAQVQGASTATESSARAYEAESRVRIGQAQLRIEALKSNVQVLIEKLKVLVESVKGGAQVAAQLAASALSSVNLSGGISASTSESRSASSSNSTSRSASDSYSISESHIFQHSDD